MSQLKKRWVTVTVRDFDGVLRLLREGLGLVDSLAEAALLFEQVGTKTKLPLLTPWNDHIQPLKPVEGLQITLFVTNGAPS